MPWYATLPWGDQRWFLRNPNGSLGWATAGCHRNFATESPGHWSSTRHPEKQKCQKWLRHFTSFQPQHIRKISWVLTCWIMLNHVESCWPETTIHHGLHHGLLLPSTLDSSEHPNCTGASFFNIQLALLGTVWYDEAPFHEWQVRRLSR